MFTILAVAYVAVSVPAPGLTARHGRTVIAAGGTSLTIGLALLAAAIGEIGVRGSILALVPGLVLVGAGIGLCFTPLTSTVLSHVDAAHAGAASGALSTTQQAGFATGVAVTGLIFFGGHDIARAFAYGLVELTGLAVGVVVMTRLLPRRADTCEPASRPTMAPGADAETVAR